MLYSVHYWTHFRSVVANLRRRLHYHKLLLCLDPRPNVDDVARPKTLRCVYIKKSCLACQLLWLPTPTDLIWMTGVAYLTIFGHTCCSVVGHSQSRPRPAAARACIIMTRRGFVDFAFVYTLSRGPIAL